MTGHRGGASWVVATTLVVGCASSASNGTRNQVTTDGATSSGGRASTYDAASSDGSYGGATAGDASAGGATSSDGGQLATPGFVRCPVLDQIPSEGYHDCDISKQEGCCISHGNGISRIAGYGTCTEGCSVVTDTFWACDDDSDCSIGEKCATYFFNKRCMGPS